MIKLRGIYSQLLRLNFARTYRSRSDNMAHIYERASEYDGARLVIYVQVWPDGNHRVSHGWSGYQCVPPTGFRDSSEISAALADQVEKVHLTQKRVREGTGHDMAARINRARDQGLEAQK